MMMIIYSAHSEFDDDSFSNNVLNVSPSAVSRRILFMQAANSPDWSLGKMTLSPTDRR